MTFARGSRNWAVISGRPRQDALHSGEKGTVGGDVAVGHAGGVERETGIAVAIEQDESAGGVRALGKKMDSFARD